QGETILASVVASLAAIAILRAQRELDIEAALGRISRILESITDSYVGLDHRWNITYVNEAAARTLHRLVGRQRHDLLDRDFWIALPEFVGTDAEAQLRRAQHERIPVHFDTHLERVGAWFETHAYPSEEG